jgi:hypothetical protein
VALAERKRFFHWFLEFPEVMARGGFDCVLGNPPYLGGTYLSGAYGYAFCNYACWEFAPTGLSELAVFFLRRMHSLLKPQGFVALITTNSIKDGDIRRDGLEQVLRDGSQINLAVRALDWPGRANLVISLLALRRSHCVDLKVLDGKPVHWINAFLEKEGSEEAPVVLSSNAGLMFEGVKHGGEGFFVSCKEKERLIAESPDNAKVLFKCLNGQEINRKPDQTSDRYIINFLDWSKEDARRYKEPFAQVEAHVRSVRAQNRRAAYSERWWQYAERRGTLSVKLRALGGVFVVTVTTKYLNFSRSTTDQVFLNTLDILTTDRWDLYAVVQSSLHEIWARKYSGTLKQDLRYSPSKCFETFAFPERLWDTPNPALTAIGERYHEHRRRLMRELWLGLTEIYNLFHSRALSPEMVAKLSRKPADVAQAGYEGLLELRRLHVALDNAVRDAYGWQDLGLNHDFVEVETLPENDRVRFTLSPDARRELLRRLLVLNHARAETERNAVVLRIRSPGKMEKRRQTATDGQTPTLFGDS